MTNLLELAARVEALTGPCRETDAEIALAVGYAKRGAWFRAPDADPDIDVLGCGSWADAPAFTASLDAAMTLVPEGWWVAGINFNPIDFRSERDSEWHAEIAGPITWAVIEHGTPEEPVYDCHGGNASTPALALTAAALRARAAMETEQ